MKKQTGDYQYYKSELDHAIDWAQISRHERKSLTSLRHALHDLFHYEDVRIENDPAWVPDDESAKLKKKAIRMLDKPAKPTKMKPFNKLNLRVSDWLLDELRVHGNSLSKYFLNDKGVTPEKFALCMLSAGVGDSYLRHHLLLYPIMAKAAETPYGFAERPADDLSVKAKAIRLYVSAMEGLEACLPVHDDDMTDKKVMQPLVKACVDLMKAAEVHFDRDGIFEKSMKGALQDLRIRAARYLR